MNPEPKLFSTNPKDYRALRSEWVDIAAIFNGWKNTISDNEIQISIRQVLGMGYIKSVNITDVEVVKPPVPEVASDNTNQAPNK